MVRYSEDELNQALEAISNGLSLRKASLQYGVPRSTLQLRLQGSQARSIAFSDLQRLSPSQEAKLAEWVRIQHALGLPPSHQQVKEFAGRILHAMGDTQPVGRGWIQAFIRRNPSVKVQRSRSIDSRRVNGASTEVIRDWFKHLAIPEIISIKPANRYNMDETGILEGQGSNGLVLGMSETKSVRKKQPGSRAWVSIIECISALGYVLNPLVIYKGKAVQQQWFPLDLSPYEGWQFTATENGWTSDATAVEWLQKVFIPQTLPQGKEVRLLIMDGHGSHTTTDFMWLCYINNIHLLFLPPHTSHVLQPLDQSVFSPVKSAYRKELGYLSQWNDSTIVGKRNFIGCYQKARTAGMTMQNIRSGWKWTGLWPVSMAKPLMSSLLLPTTPKPSASSDQVSKGQSGGKEGKEAEGWASASSAVVWSTPRKMKDLAGQLKLFTELDNDASTQRLLFIKVKKGFSEQSYNLATAQHKLELLQAQVNNTAVRKRRAVQIDPNTKFANIKDIQQAQIEAGDKEDDEAESSASDNPSEAGSCISGITDFTVMMNMVRNHFETPQMRQSYISEWRDTTFVNVNERNPDKTKAEVLEILIERLEVIQRALPESMQNEEAMTMQLLNACAGIEECNLRLCNPAPTLGGVCAQLRSSIATAMRVVPHRQYTSEGNDQYVTDRQYRGSGRDNRFGRRGHSQGNTSSSNSRDRGPPTDKKCYVCRQHGCYSTRHTADERREAYAKFKSNKHVKDPSKNTYTSFLASYEGCDYNSSSDEDIRHHL
ncbi:transposase [Colletotrichum tabaci]|uniref:Transposase n=1 Tax=Colletotrichum tabaci TaxID=1209068 RepID=A0AAV9TNQ2_9PEZI